MHLTSLLLTAAATIPAAAELPTCDASEYLPKPGLTAESSGGTIQVRWEGESGEPLALDLGVEAGQPVVRRVAVGDGSGIWRVLGQDLRPEFHVTSGKRRISEQQLRPVRALGWEITPELLETEKWNVFWDAPLVVPGLEGVNPGLPRRPDEIRRADSSFRTRSCSITTNGSRLEIGFDGLDLGIFSGRVVFTVYRGSNLLRQEAIAKTEEPSVAYIYGAGLSGIDPGGAKLVWRDPAQMWQTNRFGGGINEQPVRLRARNRVMVLERDGGSLAVFPPPHKFFFAREIEQNLGVVYYRKDGDRSIALGVRHPEREVMYQPYGNADSIWENKVARSRRFAKGNFALYNAPPGTWQRMPVYYYLSPADGPETMDRVLRFTHGDRYKPIPGHKVAISHFHTHFAEQLQDEGSLDFQPPWIEAFRGLGVNIAMMSDFHGDGHPDDPGPIRFAEQEIYFEGARRHSDRDFLIMPGEEPSENQLGGHYTTIFPRPVYWAQVREPGQPLVEEHPRYGRVYHVGSAADELEMLRREGGLVWQAHPRTKGSTGYPEAVRDHPHFLSDRYLGGAFQSLPVDQSEARLCEKRCFSTLDDMNNWAGPKYLVAEGDTYMKDPSYDIFGTLTVNYLKLDRVPGFDEDWSPVLAALRNGDFFVTTGEVLIHDSRVEGDGVERTVVADVEWTFPLEFVEVVWGDGERTGREIISATDLPAFGRHTFRIPVDARGKKWVRFAAWDSSGSGAFTQPVHFGADRNVGGRAEREP